MAENIWTGPSLELGVVYERWRGGDGRRAKDECPVFAPQIGIDAQVYTTTNSSLSPSHTRDTV